MKAPVQNKTEYAPAPEGNQIGILIGLYYFGPQEYSYKGETKMREEVRLVFELPNAKAKFKEDKEQPYVIGKNGTYSMNERSFMRQAIEACAGKMSDAEAENFDLKQAMGKACLVNIEHYEANGNTYAGIKNVSPVPQGMEVPERTNKLTIFDVANYYDEDYNALPEWMQKKVDFTKIPSKGDRMSVLDDDGIKAEDIAF